MLLNRDREKLIQAIVFFAQNTLYLGKIKLFKLLYLLDFEHFSKTGRPVTGMEYRAWKMGPAPVALYQEWDDLEADMAAAIAIRPELVIDYFREKVESKVDFDPTHFTRREIEILDRLARDYRNTVSPAMIDVTHVENGAWDRVWRNGEGRGEPIPYELALAEDSAHRETILEAARRFFGTRRVRAH